MAITNITLQNGTKIKIEGTPEEIKRIMDLYSAHENREVKQIKKSPEKKHGQEQIDISEIVNKIKESDEFEAIEKTIFDRISIIDRVLIVLFITDKYFGNNIKLKTGEISRVLSDLGINISTSNIAKYFSSSASKYVIGDKVRKKGQPVKYKISRHGSKYIEAVLNGEPQ